MKKQNYQSPMLEIVGMEVEDAIMAFSGGGTPSFTQPDAGFDPGF